MSKVLLRILAVLSTVLFVCVTWQTVTLSAGNLRIFSTAIVVACFVVNVWILISGWRDARPAERGRFTFLLIAIFLTTAVRPLGLLNSALSGNGHNLSISLIFAPVIVFSAIAGGLLFAYAVLRHRVIDVGFVVNQTLVYGLVSFVVLLLFGLAEWGIEKILPREWAEANAVVSACVALAIFLTFHRIRDVVEHVIEGIFFHKWRQNDAQLRRFVAQAEHILKPEALRAASVAEFVRFSGGAEVVLYRAEGSSFVREAGGLAGLGQTLDADLAPIVAMRAEGKALYESDAAGLEASLVLPMIQRNTLTGFIALGAKPSGETWRPDERAALADAAQKVGLDLHALRIEELEAGNAELAARLRQSDHQLRELTLAAAKA